MTTASKPKEYKTFDEWLIGERPNRSELRKVLKRMGLTAGMQREGGNLVGVLQYQSRGVARRDLMRHARSVMADADRRRTADAALLAALETMDDDE